MAAMSRMVVPGMWASYWMMACQPTTMSKESGSSAAGERASGRQLRRKACSRKWTVWAKGPGGIP